MSTGYLLTTFPSESETFAAREIDSLQSWGCPITVFAADGGRSPRTAEMSSRAFYRPARSCKVVARSLWYLLTRYPCGTVRLLALILRTLAACPREAMTLMGNLRTIGFFAETLDHEGINHLHAYFMSWPAVIALALSVVTGRSFSLGAHARDVFVEAGDLILKVSRSTFVVVCNRQALTHLESRLSPADRGKLKLIHHGINVSGKGRLQPPRDGPPHAATRHILGIGRLIRKKGFADLLRAFAILVKRDPQCQLALIGEGPEQQPLRCLMQELSLVHCAEILGWQPPAAVVRWLGEADVLVVPSVVAEDGDRDGIPNVILEAFVAGVPVLATSLPGIREAIQDGWNGILVPPGDVPALAVALHRLLGDQVLRTHLARNAYAVAVDRFDIRETTEQLAHLFLEIGDGARTCEDRTCR